MILLMPTICFAADPCEKSENDTTNTWVLTINNKDKGSKEDLVTSLKLLGNKGFKIIGVLPQFKEKELRLVFEFDIHAYSDSLDSLEGRRIKDAVLRRLQALTANSLECND